MIKLKIRKVQAVPGGLPPISAGEYVPGTIQPHTFSIPIEYEVEGFVNTAAGLPSVGQPFAMIRNKRNGVEMIGEFSTSPVTAVDANTFTTMNSVYMWEEIP